MAKAAPVQNNQTVAAVVAQKPAPTAVPVAPVAVQQSEQKANDLFELADTSEAIASQADMWDQEGKD